LLLLASANCSRSFSEEPARIGCPSREILPSLSLRQDDARERLRCGTLSYIVPIRVVLSTAKDLRLLPPVRPRRGCSPWPWP